MECIFCDILQKKLPADIVYEDEKSLVFLDINPVQPGHCLVVPKEHYEDVLSMPEELAARLFEVTQRVARAVKQALGAEGINISINNGSAAGQVVFHTHFHIIPRYQSDGLKLWPGSQYKNNEEKKKIVEKIKANL